MRSAEEHWRELTPGGGLCSHSEGLTLIRARDREVVLECAKLLHGEPTPEVVILAYAERLGKGEIDAQRRASGTHPGPPNSEGGP